MGNAQLVALGFGVAFAATGVGAPVGFLIGSIVGNLLFPPSPLTSEGPRLGDLNQSSSSFGAPRALGFGTVRQGGNVIWQLPIQEKKRTTTISGGKGSMSGAPDTKQTTYSYFGTWAQAFGEGPANTVLRIWFDGKIVFDRRGVETATQKAGVNFRFYEGNETQLVDASIEADKGVDQAPANRGTVYIVFDDVPLADYGNRFPNVTAEIAYTATDARTSQISTDGVDFDTTTFQGDMFAVDWDRGFAYAADVTGGTSTTTYLRKFRLDNLQEIQQISAAEATGGSEAFISGSFIHVTPNGDILMTVTGTNTRPIVLFDKTTLREKARFGTSSASLSMLKTGFTTARVAANVSLFGLTGRKDYVLIGSHVSDNFGILEVTSDSIGALYGDDFDGGVLFVTGKETVWACVGGREGEGEATGYFITADNISPNTDPMNLYKVEIDQSAQFSAVGGVDVFSGIEVNKLVEFTWTDIFPTATGWGNGRPSLWYDETDDTVILFANGNSPVEGRFFKVNTTTGAIIWISDPVGAGVKPNDSRNGSASRLRNGTLGGMVANNGYMLDTVTGEYIINDTAPDWTDHDANTGAFGFYDSITETWIGPAASGESSAIVRYFIRRKTDTGISVGTVVKAIADRTGLVSSTDLDTTSIDSTIVTGFLIGRQSSARAAINPLSQLFFFDGFESDDKLRFVLRGGASARTITQPEFANLDKNGQIIKEARTQEIELPERFSLLYLDKDNDYLQNAHNAKRIKNPTPAMSSNNELGLDFPGSLTASFAKQAAEKMLYTTWTERSQFQIKVPWTHLDLDPSDIITLTLDNSQTLRARLVQIDVGADFSLDMVAVGEETQQFISTVLGDAGSGVPTQSVQASFFITGLILDVPLLRDQDEVPSRASNPLYAAEGGFIEGQFTAGTLYKSSDGGSSFSEEKSFVSEMAYGSTLNALGTPLSVWQTDNVNTLNVQMVTGASEMVSVSNLEMLNGANFGAVFKANGEIEIIQFQTVVVETDGSLTLSVLLRGRRGTDLFTTGHLAGETFLFLNPLDMEIVTLTLGERNSSLLWRHVGAGQLFDNGEDQTLTSVHRALMPYTVQHQAMVDGASSSTDFSWVRRTRVGGALQDGFGTVPLSEDTEEYELEIFDMPAGSVVRTVTGLTTPDYNYTSGDQTTDGFTPPIQTATIKVYQISAQVGRGFSEEVTINV